MAEQPKVFVSQRVFAGALDRLREAGMESIGRMEDTPLPASELRDAVADVDALVCLITDRIDADLMQAAPKLRVVANVGVGYDNIDVSTASRSGIAVCNTPDVLTDATADLTLALMLAVARRIPEADAYLRGGRFTHFSLDSHMMGADITGQRLGIIGLGKIGRAVALRAIGGFDMQVTYTGRRRLSATEERDLGVQYAEFDRLLGTSDFVSLHAPLLPETRHLINAAALARMKDTAIIINTSRGPLVDEAALATALSSGLIAGAGLDVYEHEPAVHPVLLEQRHNVVLLPHVGSATGSTRRRMAQMAAENVIAVLTGEGHPALVNPEVWGNATD